MRFNGIVIENTTATKTMNFIPAATKVWLVGNDETIDLTESGLVKYPIKMGVDAKGLFVDLRLPLIGVNIKER